MTLLQYKVINPIIGTIPVLHHANFVWFIIITLMIAGAGYVVNDIYDRDIDKVNKPSKTFIPEPISVKMAWNYYYTLIFIGFLLSIFIAFKTINLANLWIYPLATLILFMYAKKWKSSILVGNIIVSLFVAFIWGILFYVQFSNRPIFNENHLTHVGAHNILWELCWIYFTFAFLINFSREIVKDMEDMEGDKNQGLQTLPIFWGLKKTKMVVFVLLLVLAVGVAAWIFISQIGYPFHIRMYYLVFVVAPLLSLLTKLVMSKHKNDFSTISKGLKWVMLFALFGILLIGNTLNI